MLKEGRVMVRKKRGGTIYKGSGKVGTIYKGSGFNKRKKLKKALGRRGRKMIRPIMARATRARVPRRGAGILKGIVTAGKGLLNGLGIKFE